MSTIEGWCDIIFTFTLMFALALVHYKCLISDFKTSLVMATFSSYLAEHLAQPFQISFSVVFFTAKKKKRFFFCMIPFRDQHLIFEDNMTQELQNIIDSTVVQTLKIAFLSSNLGQSYQWLH